VPFSLSSRTRGPFFKPLLQRRVRTGIDDVLRGVAIEGEKLTKRQLYPGHGVVTRHLRESVAGGLVRHLLAQVDAGERKQGANIVYAFWVETGKRRGKQTRFPGYHMFANTRRKLDGMRLGRIVKKRLMRPLT
jgi:hypothetical protein